MGGMEGEIERVLQSPSEGRVSRSDETVPIFYEFYAQTRMGEMVVYRGKVSIR